MDVAVVFDTESGDTPIPIGTFIRQDEDAIMYCDSSCEGTIHIVPQDCVKVVTVNV